MDFNDFFGFFGYKETNEVCEDIPGGFQDLNPELFVLIGELLGNAIAGNLPFNVQNALGNWFQLVGQAMLTFNAQQQYFQGGTGRYYNPKYKNVANPFCGANAASQAEGPYGGDGGGRGSTATNNTNNNINSNMNDKIEELTREIENLKEEINNLKEKGYK